MSAKCHKRTFKISFSPKEKPRDDIPGFFRSLSITDYFGASGPTNLRPLGPVPLTWINVGSRIST